MATKDYTLQIPIQAPARKTYPQNWPAYTAAQCAEKETVMALLADLCAQIEEPKPKRGRPAFPAGRHGLQRDDEDL